MTFADLTGDNNRIHTDAEFSKAGPFGQRIAHGLLGLSIASGLAWQTGILDGTVIAFREVNEWKFIKPVFIGDSVQAELNVTEAKALPRIGAGSVVDRSGAQEPEGRDLHEGQLDHAGDVQTKIMALNEGPEIVYRSREKL